MVNNVEMTKEQAEAIAKSIAPESIMQKFMGRPTFPNIKEPIDSAIVQTVAENVAHKYVDVERERQLGILKLRRDIHKILLGEYESGRITV